MSIVGPGIVTGASGHRKFLDQAVALAASIRINSPETPVGLITDLPVTSHQHRLFAAIRHFDFAAHPGVGYKLHYDELCIFPDGNLFLDSDSLCYGSLTDFLGSLSHHDVASFCYPAETHGHWFVNRDDVRRYDDERPFPGLSGDAHYVKPGTAANNFFSQVRDIASRYDALGFARWRGGINEEPVFALAYWNSLITCPPRDESMLGQATAGRCRRFFSDCRRGKLRAEYHDGRILHPLLFHFEAYANRPSYQYEVARLLADVDRLGPIRCATAVLHHFGRYVWDRRRKVLRRCAKLIRQGPESAPPE
jgi:hypothetical protein